MKNHIFIAVLVAFVLFLCGTNIENRSKITELTEQIETLRLEPKTVEPQEIQITPMTYEDPTTTRLYVLANMKMADLLRTGYWSHNNNDGTTLQQRVSTVSLREVGEILYKGNCDYKQALDLWTKSASHLDVMKDKTYKHMVAVMDRDNNTGICYIVQEYSK